MIILLILLILVFRLLSVGESNYLNKRKKGGGVIVNVEDEEGKYIEHDANVFEILYEVKKDLSDYAVYDEYGIEITDYDALLTNEVTVRRRRSVMSSSSPGWSCPQCTFENNESSEMCGMCNYKPAGPKRGSIFYIYTTGLADWGAYNIADMWGLLRDKLIDMILPNFDSIIINHYDPYFKEENPKLLALKRGDNNVNSSRVKANFNPTFFNFKSIEQRNYIIIDMAHVISYAPDGPQIFDNETETIKEKFPGLKVIYPGYCEIGQMKSETMSNDKVAVGCLNDTDFIRIDASGGVTTIMDKIYELSIKDEFVQQRIGNYYKYPPDIVKDILEAIKEKTSQTISSERGIGIVKVEDDITDPFFKSYKNSLELKQKIVSAIMNDRISLIYTFIEEQAKELARRL